MEQEPTTEELIRLAREHDLIDHAEKRDSVYSIRSEGVHMAMPEDRLRAYLQALIRKKERREDPVIRHIQNEKIE